MEKEKEIPHFPLCMKCKNCVWCGPSKSIKFCSAYKKYFVEIPFDTAYKDCDNFESGNPSVEGDDAMKLMGL